MSPSQNFTPRLYHGVGPPLPAGLALLIYAFAVSTFLAVLIIARGGVLVAALAELLAFVVLPVAALRVHGATVRDLGLARPPLLTVVGAVVIGLGLWLVTLWLATPVIQWTGREDAIRELNERMSARDVALPLVIAAHALAPSLGEELVHRGLLLGALAPRVGRFAALAITSILFAALHIEPARMVSTLVLGVFAGTLALWARSVWPAIVLHAVNNTVALLLMAGIPPGAAEKITDHTWPSFGIAVGFCVLGLLLASIGRQRS